MVKILSSWFVYKLNDTNTKINYKKAKKLLCVVKCLFFSVSRIFIFRIGCTILYLCIVVIMLLEKLNCF